VNPELYATGGEVNRDVEVNLNDDRVTGNVNK
jgi:hypothetical protein